MDLKAPAADIQHQSLQLQYKAYAAIVYLWAVMEGIEHPQALFVWRAYVSTPSRSQYVDELVSYVTHAFKLVDREDAPRAIHMVLDDARVSDFFPSANERLAVREWLVTLFVAMDLDTRVIELAFPRTHSVRPE
jgi:hypothetical protein